MQLYSTQQARNTRETVTFKDAIFKGLPEDGGLFMPVSFPRLPDEFFAGIQQLSFQDIAFTVARALLKEEIPEPALRAIVNDAINFDAPLVTLEPHKHVLELFQGPTLAFKDFGARFMSRVMSYFLNEGTVSGPVHILVATSGDTGSAVAQGFYNVPGIRVTLLYPKGKVSTLQEQQLTTAGGNVEAIEVDGTFDDCQRMVKEAFLDKELNRQFHLASANSINISRLIPQSFYYFHAYAQLPDAETAPVFCVPSGNFGNLCGALIARQMGLPVAQIIAATNINKIVPEYLQEGIFRPRPSVSTVANAMDVGNPSNFARLQAFFDPDSDPREHMIKLITGKFYNDHETLATLKEVQEQFHYTMCPHTAIGYRGLSEYPLADGQHGIVLATAHPAKFIDVVEPVIKGKVNLPDPLKEAMSKEKKAISMANDFEFLKAYLLG